MQDIGELVKVLLTYFAVYLGTVWKLVFHPAQVFQSSAPNAVCPPAIALIFTVGIVYYALRIGIPEEGLKKIEWFDGRFVIGFAAAYVAIIANLEAGALAEAGDVSHISFQTQLGALVYAICPVYLVTALVFLVILIPLRRWVLLPFALIQGLYWWCLYNVCRWVLRFSEPQAIKGAFYAYVGFLLGGFSLAGLGAILVFARKQWKGATGD